jgi:mannose-6-phosphate isomerase-like protein (cupin superfamily)
MVEKVFSGNSSEFWIRERCFIRELINDSSIKDFSLAEARVEPGVRTELHRLAVDEWYAITAGAGRMTVGENELQDVGVGDIVQIPAGTAQQIENTGSEDLVFKCICLPRFTPDSYESLEDR